MTAHPEFNWSPTKRDRESAHKKAKPKRTGRYLISLCPVGAAVLLAWVGLPAPKAQAPPAEAGWRAGVASIKITPERPLRMSGYAARVKAFEDVEQDIFARALVLDDGLGTRAVLVTTDLIGIRADLAEEIYTRLPSELGLGRSQVLFSASHSHSGPALSLSAEASEGRTAEEAENTAAYTRQCVDQIVELVVRASRELVPVRILWGTGVAHIAMNRREFTPTGVILGVNPRGLVDRSVPVMRIEKQDGEPLAAIFSYACHNTTLTGENLSVSGDYSGFAQSFVEQKFPGLQPMFMSGCGGDANPYPRGTMELAQVHGRELGAEVVRVLRSEMREIQGPLRVTFDHAALPLQQHSRSELERLASSSSSLDRNTARRRLELLDRGEEPLQSYSAPVAVWQFGRDLTLVALPSEVVVDYVHFLERALGPLRLWIVAYSNDYFGYIPSPRVLEEGGYESRGLFSGDGWFAPQVSEVLVGKVRELAREAGRDLPD